MRTHQAIKPWPRAAVLKRDRFRRPSLKATGLTNMGYQEVVVGTRSTSLTAAGLTRRQRIFNTIIIVSFDNTYSYR